MHNDVMVSTNPYLIRRRKWKLASLHFNANQEALKLILIASEKTYYNV